jgi:hypothetical protein
MRGLSTMPIRPPSAPRDGYRGMRGAPGAVGRRPLHTATYPSAVTPVLARRGVLGRWRERVRGAIPFSREEQFRLLEVGLRIKLRHEGKPEDAIVLQRPDDLPAAPGTPVRIGSRQRGARGDGQRAGSPAGVCR